MQNKFGQFIPRASYQRIKMGIKSSHCLLTCSSGNVIKSHKPGCLGKRGGLQFTLLLPRYVSGEGKTVCAARAGWWEIQGREVWKLH